MAIDVSDLATQMLGAAKDVFMKKWPDVEEYAKTEFKNIAENIAMIERMKLTEKITEEQAKLHFDIQKNASRTVLLTLEGIGILLAEAAINAALGVVKEAVNSALGFALI